MPIIPFPEWAPDQPDFNPPGSSVIRNCVPRTAKSYGPMPTPQLYSQNALDARCQGSYSYKDENEAVYIFAGDATKLYLIPPTAEAFTDASRTTGGAYTTPPVSSGGFWSMTSYGKRIIATNWNDPIQTILLPAESRFSALSATAPRARFVTTVKDFVFVANTVDPTDGAVPFRCWWSALGQPANWPTPGTVTAQQLQSDFQDLQQTDLGAITGLSAGFLGAADVAVFMERGIWTFNYVGPPVIFSTRVVQGAPGAISPLSIVQSRARGANGVVPATYYLGSDGFSAFTGDTAIPIGAQKFDAEFFREASSPFLPYVQGVADPSSKIIAWAFCSETATDGLFDRVLVYNWELQRAVICELNPEINHAEWLTQGIYGNSYNLDELDQFGNLEVIRPSFDDRFWLGDRLNRISTFRADHTLATWSGRAMGPTLDIPEIEFAQGRRSWVTNARPLIDGAVSTATVQAGRRDRLADPIAWQAEVPVNIIGECPQRVSGRYIRLRLKIPPGQAFEHLQGLDVTAGPGGRLR